MQRRNFLKMITLGLGATGLGSFFYSMIRYIIPTAGASATDKITLDKNELVPGAFKELYFNGKPIIVINRRGEGYIALSRVCTHLGCLVSYDRDGEIFICPCHAAEFTNEGRRISGPANRPLESIRLKVEADRIIIG